MPLFNDLGHVVLRCVNFHGAEYLPRISGKADPEHLERSLEPPKTTMEALPNRAVVPGMIPNPELEAAFRAIKAGKPDAPAPHEPIYYMNVSSGATVQLYVCRICGYVEMYSVKAGHSSEKKGV
jgi:hypothetical protein